MAKEKKNNKPPKMPENTANGSSYIVFNSGKRPGPEDYEPTPKMQERMRTFGTPRIYGGSGAAAGPLVPVTGAAAGVGTSGLPAELDPQEFSEVAPIDRPAVPPLEEQIPEQNVDNSILGKFIRFMDNVWFDDAGGMLRGESGFLAEVPLYEETVGNVAGAALSVGSDVINALNWGSDQMNHLGAALMSALPGGIQTLTWDQSQEISLGQVVAANAAINNRAGITGWLINTATGQQPYSLAMGIAESRDPDNILYSDNFQILDPEIRKDAFESGGMGQITSGFADAVWMVAADPLIIAGPTSSVIRFGSKAGKFSGVTNRALNNITQIDEFGEGALQQGRLISELGIDEARRSGQITAQGEYLISAMEGKADELFNHPFVRNANDKRAVQSLLGDTSLERPDEAAALVGAMAGHPGSWENLRNLNADMYESAAMALGVNPLAPTGSNLNDFATAGIKLNDEQRNLAEDIVYERLAERPDLVDDLAASGQLIARGGARIGPRTVRAKNAWRAGAARQSMTNKPVTSSALGATPKTKRGHFVYDMVYGVAGSRPLRVVRWLGQGTPNGIIQLKEGADSMNSLDEFAAWMRKSPMDTNTSRQFFNEFAAARTVQERKNIVLAAEEAMIEAIAAASKGRMTVESARAAYSGYKSRRAAVLEEAHRTENNFAVDPTTGEYVKMPGFYAELDQSFPLLDVKEFRRVVANNRGFEYLSEGLQGADYLNSLWKISVLARLGYTQRNIAEGAMRSVAVLGVAAANPKSLTMLPANIRYAARMRRGMRAADAEMKRLQDAQFELQQTRNMLENLRNTDANLFDDVDETLRQIGALTLDEQAYITKVDELSKSVEKILENIREAEAGRWRVGRRENVMYDGSVMQGAFQGAEGSLAYTAASADATTYLTFDTSIARRYERMLNHPDFKRLDPRQLTADQMPQYFAEYAFRLNFRYRSDPLGRLILSDQPLEDIISAMKRTENQGYLKQMSAATGRDLSSDQGLRSYVAEQIRRLDNEVPADSGLRQRLLDGDVTANEIQAALGSRELPVIVGRIDDGMPASSGILGKTKKNIDKSTATLMKWLGTVPEDKLLRHPFYDAVYRREQDRLYRIAVERGADMQSEIVRNRINRTAHRIALKSTRETMYTIDRLSNAAVMLRFVSPFFPAWENSVRTWGRIAWTNPAVVGVGNILWNVPNNLGLVVDENGDPVESSNFLRDEGNFIIWPEPVVNLLNKTPFGPGQELKTRQSSTNVIFPGGQWWFPGAGPSAGIPAALFLRGKPEDAEIIKNALGEEIYNQIVPMGQVQGDLIDALLPTVGRRLRQMWRGESSDTAFLTTWNNIIEDEYISVQLEGRAFTEEDAKRAAAKADRFWKWQIGAAAAMPFQSTVNSKYQVQRDIWNKLIDDTSLSYDEKIRLFKESFNELESDSPYFGKGDAFMAITRSGTYSETKLRPNLTTWARITKNKDLVDRLYGINPELVGMFGNMGSFDDPFSYAVYGEFGATTIGPDGNKITRKLRPSEIIRNNQIADGWQIWWRIKDSVEQKAIDLGYSSIQVKEAKPLRDILDEAETVIGERFEPWLEEKRAYENNFSDFLKGARILVENADLVNEDSTIRTLASYLKIRDQVAEQLDGVTDQDVRDQIKQLGYAAAFQLRQSDIGFADFYDQYLDKDDFRRD